MSVISEHLKNAPLPMVFTSFGIVIFSVVTETDINIPFTITYSPLCCFNQIVLLKALYPILITLLGIDTFARFLQFSNAL